MAWMLLLRALVAVSNQLKSKKKKDFLYYERQVKNAEFFINSILSITLGKKNAIEAIVAAAVESNAK